MNYFEGIINIAIVISTCSHSLIKKTVDKDNFDS